jgi:hypothetical protein
LGERVGEEKRNRDTKKMRNKEEYGYLEAMEIGDRWKGGLVAAGVGLERKRGWERIPHVNFLFLFLFLIFNSSVYTCGFFNFF